MATRINVPVLINGKRYEGYKLELLCWNSVTEIPIEKRVTVVAFEEHSSKIKDEVFDQISTEVFSPNDGLGQLITFMDERLLKDDLEDAIDKYVIGFTLDVCVCVCVCVCV
jgi:hypothetical protein